MLLTTEERVRFIQYLELDADSSEGMAVQIERLNTPPTNMLAKKLRQEALASRIIAAKLKSAEEMSVSK